MGMKTALVYLVILTLVMGGALAYGFIVGDFWKDGGELIENPWGIVSLFDVYVGFFFFIDSQITAFLIFSFVHPIIVVLSFVTGGLLISVYNQGHTNLSKLPAESLSRTNNVLL